MTVSGQTAFVTGATGGIGRALTFALAQDGWKLVVHGRSEARCAELSRSLIAAGHLAPVVLVADFLSLAAIAELGALVRDFGGPVRLLINNAGSGFEGDGRPSSDGYDRAMQVNYMAPWILMTMLRKKLSESPGAAVLNVGSVGQHRLGRRCPFAPVSSDGLAYGRSKLALAMACRTLAPVFEAEGVSLVQAHPGTMVRSGMSLRLLSALPWLPRAALRIASRGAPSADQAARFILSLLGTPGQGGRLRAARSSDARDHSAVDDAAARSRLEVLTRQCLMPVLRQHGSGRADFVTSSVSYCERAPC